VISEERLLKEWDVFVEELFLKILSAGGDDHAFAGADHRKQVRKRLSCSSAGFDDEMPFFLQRLLDGLRHLELAAPELIGGMRAREDSAGGEELVER
jgi:hypothetical protein